VGFFAKVASGLMAFATSGNNLAFAAIGNNLLTTLSHLPAGMFNS